MEKDKFLERVPHVYHLTDERNIPFMQKQKRLLSTVEIAELFNLPENLLTQRRPQHVQASVNGDLVFIRDQRPLNKALAKCLTNGWTEADFIRHLNSRVFMWPNVHRLNIHYSRYKAENPVIFRFKTEELLDLNDHVEFSRINSGASRPLAHYGGLAVPRGQDTFLPFERVTYPAREVVEVTFPGNCILPNQFEVGRDPDGPWATFKM